MDGLRAQKLVYKPADDTSRNPMYSANIVVDFDRRVAFYKSAIRSFHGLAETIRTIFSSYFQKSTPFRSENKEARSRVAEGERARFKTKTGTSQKVGFLNFRTQGSPTPYRQLWKNNTGISVHLRLTATEYYSTRDDSRAFLEMLHDVPAHTGWNSIENSTVLMSRKKRRQGESMPRKG